MTFLDFWDETYKKMVENMSGIMHKNNSDIL